MHSRWRHLAQALLDVIGLSDRKEVKMHAML
nr:hypothetical protein UQVBLVYK_UQVBLVYK_CDS_0006 [Microvirus sp.]